MDHPFRVVFLSLSRAASLRLRPVIYEKYSSYISGSPEGTAFHKSTYPEIESNRYFISSVTQKPRCILAQIYTSLGPSLSKPLYA
jgi:hypothetical protein